MTLDERVSLMRGVVSIVACRALLRTLWEDFCERGVSAEELRSWREVACPFPHLRELPAVLAMRRTVAEHIGAVGTPCEAQFIWHLPQSDAYNAPPPHFDQEPYWATHGRTYEVIAGLALNTWHSGNGSLRYWQDGQPHSVRMLPGDVIVMGPQVPHAAGVNHGTEIRAGVYFRWLNAAAAGAGGQ